MSRRGEAGHRVPGLEGRCGRAWPGLRPCTHAEAHAGLSRPGAPCASGPVPMHVMFLGKVLGSVLWSPPFCPLSPVSDAALFWPVFTSLLSPLSVLRLHCCLQASSSCGGLSSAERRPWHVGSVAEAHGLRGPEAHAVFSDQ